MDEKLSVSKETLPAWLCVCVREVGKVKKWTRRVKAGPVLTAWSSTSGSVAGSSTFRAPEFKSSSATSTEATAPSGPLRKRHSTVFGHSEHRGACECAGAQCARALLPAQCAARTFFFNRSMAAARVSSCASGRMTAICPASAACCSGLCAAIWARQGDGGGVCVSGASACD